MAERIYLAEMHTATRTEQVIIKFAHSYSPEAHRVCEMIECAPKLYFAEQVPYFFAAQPYDSYEFYVGRSLYGSCHGVHCERTPLA